MFVGHADGALVALLATAMAADSNLPGWPVGGTGGDRAAHDSDDDGERSSGSSAFGSSAGLAEAVPMLRRGGSGSGVWRSLLGGPLAPLAERGEAGDVETGLLQPPSRLPSSSLDSVAAARASAQQVLTASLVGVAAVCLALWLPNTHKEAAARVNLQVCVI